MTEEEADRAATARNLAIGESGDEIHFAVAVQRDDGGWEVEIREDRPRWTLRNVLKRLPFP